MPDWKRFDPYIREFGESGMGFIGDMQECDRGRWVRYAEAESALTAAQARIEAEKDLEAELEEFERGRRR